MLFNWGCQKYMKKPFKKALVSALIVSATITLTACGGADRLVKEVEKVTEQNAQNQDLEKKKQDSSYEEKVKEWEEMYSGHEQSREETLGQVVKKSVGPVNNEPIVVKDVYTNPDDLARFASDILFNFYRGDIGAEDYVIFLEQYGSKQVKGESLTGDHKEDVKLMDSIQSRIRDEGIEYASYEVSKVKMEGKIAVFYRKLNTSTGLQAFFKTTLIKEDGHWYFHNDEPSVPVAFE